MQEQWVLSHAGIAGGLSMGDRQRMRSGVSNRQNVVKSR
jgi:hypothetical protein